MVYGLAEKYFTFIDCFDSLLLACVLIIFQFPGPAPLFHKQQLDLNSGGKCSCLAALWRGRHRAEGNTCHRITRCHVSSCLNRHQNLNIGGVSMVGYAIICIFNKTFSSSFKVKKDNPQESRVPHAMT